MDYHQPKKSKSNKKTLCLADIKDFKYRYKSERSARTPRYRFVSRKPKKGNSTETTEEDLTEGDATAMCHSPGSSTSETSIGENTEIDDPKMGNSDVIRFNKADMDFDFGFDPERDANLMTSNFFQQFSNDKVGFEEVMQSHVGTCRVWPRLLFDKFKRNVVYIYLLPL